MTITSLLLKGYFIASLLIIAIFAYLLVRKHRQVIKLIQQDTSEKLAQFNQQLEKELKQRISETNQTNKELYKANILLNQEKDKSGAVIKYMADGIVVIDNEGIIMEINELALELLENINKNIIGRHVEEIITYKQYLEALEKIQNNKQEKVDMEIPLIRDDKTAKILNVKITRAIDKKGNPLGLISVIRDITKQKELDHLKNNFIRTISHELRTPLTSIIGFIDILKSEKRGPLTGEQKEYLEVILKGSLHLRQLINDLLDISLMESKKLKIKIETINLYKMYKEIILSFMPQARLKGIELILVEDAAIPSVWTDEDKARRIFINIISNAIKFTEKGHVKVYFSLKDNYLNTHVEDSGIGINKKEKDIIFEKFRQIDSSSTRKYEGLGIGLPIVKDLLNLLGGTIEVISEENKGSVFTFSLPINYEKGIQDERNE
ncbi:MAG TPA: hypothetical protein DF296_00425 [Candidatus Margulisbacteria bacterium]|nr:MAG: hypothetical protein A2X41_04105 [Candidatus Margulisbacteria bacterium GWE2_39_32]HCT83648.1 hypothetical protein [Candidatus Margulisiibacteriota bacterium]